MGGAVKRLTYGHKMPVHVEMSGRELWGQADLGVISTEVLVRAKRMHDISQEE